MGPCTRICNELARGWLGRREEGAWGWVEIEEDGWHDCLRRRTGYCSSILFALQQYRGKRSARAAGFLQLKEWEQGNGSWRGSGHLEKGESQSWKTSLTSFKAFQFATLLPPGGGAWESHGTIYFKKLFFSIYWINIYVGKNSFLSVLILASSVFFGLLIPSQGMCILFIICFQGYKSRKNV